MDESFFFAEGTGRFIVHFDHLGGVDDADAMVAETTIWKGGVDGRLIAHEEKSGNSFVGLQRELHTGNDHAASVVAAHDIHCDFHKANCTPDVAQLATARPARVLPGAKKLMLRQ